MTRVLFSHLNRNFNLIHFIFKIQRDEIYLINILQSLVLSLKIIQNIHNSCKSKCFRLRSVSIYRFHIDVYDISQNPFVFKSVKKCVFYKVIKVFK